MMVHATTHKMTRVILDRAGRGSFVPLLGSSVFASALSVSLPVERLVVVAALVRRKRCVAIAPKAAHGSAVASLDFDLAFRQFGWSIFENGVLAQFGLMALRLPLPKLPKLVVAGIYRLPIADVFIGIIAGKMIEYHAYACASVRFLGALRPLTARATPSSRSRSREWKTLVIAGVAISRRMRIWTSSATALEEATRSEGTNIG